MVDFERTFADTVEELERDAKRVGLTQEAMAAAGQCSSATIRRWKRRSPETVKIVARIQAAIEAKRQTITA